MTNSRDLLPIQKLYEWSSNFDSGKNPYCVFMDLVGYSEDRYGVNTYCGKNYSDVLGYKELSMLADALKVYESRGHDEIYRFLDYLEPDCMTNDEDVDFGQDLEEAMAYYNPPLSMTEERNANS